MDTKQKYVRLAQWDMIIIFSTSLDHSDFKFLNPVSAGFCYVNDKEIRCFGESVSLKLKSHPDDSKYATKQVFGIDAMLEFELQDKL